MKRIPHKWTLRHYIRVLTVPTLLCFSTFSWALPVPSFAPATGSPVALPAAVSYSTQSVVQGDFNGDTFPDLVVSHIQSRQVSVLLNNGSAGFAAAAGSPFTVLGLPTGVAVGDVNGDGKLDWVSANSDTAPTTYAGTLSVGLGDGLGGFTVTTSAQIPNASGLDTLQLRDIDGDTVLDLVVLGIGKIHVLKGDGFGGFSSFTGSPLTAPTIGGWPISWSAWDLADLNGDGNADIVVVGDAYPAYISVFLGNGAGGFAASAQTPISVLMPFLPNDVKCLDVDGDGNLDITMTDSDGMMVYLNDGAAGFSDQQSYLAHFSPASYTPFHTAQLALGDVNGDGINDVGAVGGDGQVWLGDGQGGFMRFPLIALPFTGISWSQVLVGDWNNDGKKDLLFGGSNLEVQLNQGIVGQSPSAVGTQIVVSEGGSANGWVTGSSPNANAILTYTLISFPTKGTVQLNTTTGGFIYTPRSQNNSVPSPLGDSFLVVVNDGTWESSSAVVRVSINLTNAAPVASNGSASFKTGTTYSGWLNSSDPDWDPLTYIIVTQPAHGVLVHNSATSSSFTYAANAGYIGPDSFTFKVNDGALDSNIATFDLTVRPLNSPPVVQDGTLLTYDYWPTNTFWVTASDPDFNPLTYSIVTPPAHGTAVIDTWGQITYTQDAGYTGIDSLTFKANDGQLDSNVGTLSIQIQTSSSPTYTPTSPTFPTSPYSDPYSGSGVTTKPALPVGCFIGMLGW